MPADLMTVAIRETWKSHDRQKMKLQEIKFNVVIKVNDLKFIMENVITQVQLRP